MRRVLICASLGWLLERANTARWSHGGRVWCVPSSVCASCGFVPQDGAAAIANRRRGVCRPGSRAPVLGTRLRARLCSSGGLGLARHHFVGV